MAAAVALAPDNVGVIIPRGATLLTASHTPCRTTIPAAQVDVLPVDFLASLNHSALFNAVQRLDQRRVDLVLLNRVAVLGANPALFPAHNLDRRLFLTWSSKQLRNSLAGHHSKSTAVCSTKRSSASDAGIT